MGVNLKILDPSLQFLKNARTPVSTGEMGLLLIVFLPLGISKYKIEATLGFAIVCNQNHYFGIGLIPRLKPKWEKMNKFEA